MQMNLPNLPRPEPDQLERLLPLAVGAGLLAAGALLWHTQPRALQLPEPVALGKTPHNGLIQRAARRSRDGLGLIAPRNLATSLGRSLAIAGVALLFTRLLDELAAPRTGD